MCCNVCCGNNCVILIAFCHKMDALPQIPPKTQKRSRRKTKRTPAVSHRLVGPGSASNEKTRILACGHQRGHHDWRRQHGGHGVPSQHRCAGGNTLMAPGHGTSARLSADGLAWDSGIPRRRAVVEVVKDLLLFAAVCGACSCNGTASCASSTLNPAHGGGPWFMMCTAWTRTAVCVGCARHRGAPRADGPHRPGSGKPTETVW